MVPIAKEILFSRSFPGQIIQDLKVINQDMCEKDIMIIHCMIDIDIFMIQPPPHPL